MENDDGKYGGKGKTRRKGGVTDAEITPIGWSAVKRKESHKPPPKDPGSKPPPFVEPKPPAPQKPPPQTPP